MRIVLADDHELVRKGLKFFLERLAPEVSVVEAASVADVLDAAAKERPDLVILDLKMPGMDGFAGLDRCRERLPKVPIVLLSGRATRHDILEALRRGAAGYLPKTLSGRAMVAALRLVLAGEVYVPAALVEGPVARFAPAAGGSPLERLTLREREVLDLLCEGRSNKDIGRELGIREVTVKVHVGHVMRKLGATNRTDAVRMALDLRARA